MSSTHIGPGTAFELFLSAALDPIATEYDPACDGLIPHEVPPPAPVDVPYAMPYEPVTLPAPGVSRADGEVLFAAAGYVYELRRSVGGWSAVAVCGGLAGPVSRKTQGAAVAAVWEATGAALDVGPAVVTERTVRTQFGPERRASVTCEGVSLHLIPNPRKGSADPWAEPCTRCGGKGWLQAYEHVKGGVCFECDGGRVAMPYTLEEAAATVRRMAREERAERDRRAVATERKRRRWARFETARPAVAAWMVQAQARGSKFAGKLRARALAGHELSAAQVQACADAQREDYARDVAAAYAEQERRERARSSRAAGVSGERVSVTGTVRYAKAYLSGPSWRPVSKRRVVVDADADGVSVKVFTSAKAARALSAGDRVTVTGEVKDPENRDWDTGEIQTVLARAVFETAK